MVGFGLFLEEFERIVNLKGELASQSCNTNPDRTCPRELNKWKVSTEPIYEHMISILINLSFGTKLH